MIHKRYLKYGAEMTAISMASSLLYGFATSLSGPLWVIPLWLITTGTMFFVRYGMIKTNRPCSDCPIPIESSKPEYEETEHEPLYEGGT
jgi:hypothetical protein